MGLGEPSWSQKSLKNWFRKGIVLKWGLGSILDGFLEDFGGVLGGSWKGFAEEFG